jgi:endonuclease/exonuclease/phosphatase (EEP) superfamily protein YafD
MGDSAGYRVKLGFLLGRGLGKVTQLRLGLVYFLLVLLAYRYLVERPLGLDVYLLYLPGVVFLTLLVPLVGFGLLKGNGLRWFSLAFGTLIILGGLSPLRLHLSKQDAGSLRIVSLNVQSYGTDLEASMRLLTGLKPDFICIQEIWTRDHLKQVMDQCPDYEFQSHPDEREVENYFVFGTFVAVGRGWQSEMVAGPGETASVLVKKGGQELAVVSWHGRKTHKYGPLGMLDTANLQRKQAEELNETSQGSTHTIIAGDFNAPDSGPAFKVLKDYHSAFHQAGTGFGLTYPAKHPFMRIDHILGSEDIEFSNFRTFDCGSDHLGIVTEFRIRSR